MQEGGNSEEFLESVKVDLFPDKVYVFTPKGEILRLPRGATCVDFAYAVHTDVGNRCVAAKVDRRLVPLRTPLRNGQTVEIITAKGATPNPSWVNFVVTAKARAADPPVPEEPASAAKPSSSAARLLNQALEEFRLIAEEGAGRARSTPWWSSSACTTRTSCTRRSASASGSRRSSRAACCRPRRATERPEAPPAPLAIAGTEGLRRHLRALLLPDPERPHPRVPFAGPRRGDPPRGLRQRRRRTASSRRNGSR